MSSNNIGSIDLLRDILHNKLQEDKDIANMLDIFISGFANIQFNIYNFTKEDGTTEPFIDYSRSTEGDWLSIGMEADEFVKSIEKIIESWPLSDEVSDTLGAELSILQKRIEKVQNKK